MHKDLGIYIKKNLRFLTNPIRAKKAGLPPGTLVYTGDVIDKEIEIKLISYDSDDIVSHVSKDITEVLNKFNKDKINWVNIDALYKTDIINEIGEYFKLHPLILEDILNTQQLPKIDIEDENVFITLKMLSINQYDEIDIEHLSFVLGTNYVISFQEKRGDVLDGVRERIINGKGKARKRTADYLLYMMIDAIVDNYYLVLDNINDKIDSLEEEIYFNPTQDNFQKIIDYKKQLIHLRKSIFPLESILRKLLDEDIPVIESNHAKYFEDILDHLKSIVQDLDIMREVLLGHIELYMSSLSNKTNEVMKTLTIVASIFIPLTFLAGVYGMNFRYMPELEWEWGYPLILTIMGLAGLGMFIYMKKKKWF
ncbi:MAG: magnesium/cobalt transporter CorA [bacterium]